tara:strand:+ start:271 stop:582 length:312 start_codon:yes stop_codon:yes gene_type:complete
MQYPLTEYAQKCAGGWIDRCPAHDDHRTSLASRKHLKVSCSSIALLDAALTKSFERLHYRIAISGIRMPTGPNTTPQKQLLTSSSVSPRQKTFGKKQEFSLGH